MKDHLFIGTLAVTAVLAALIYKYGPPMPPPAPAGPSGPAWFSTQFVDPDNGCEYVGAQGLGFTPRMGRDHQQICGGRERKGHP